MINLQSLMNSPIPKPAQTLSPLPQNNRQSKRRNIIKETEKKMFTKAFDKLKKVQKQQFEYLCNNKNVPKETSFDRLQNKLKQLQYEKDEQSEESSELVNCIQRRYQE
ncbi:Hypothetical_protein [Hexamita inflata]|uniref:Hypothetical_protein n=1 Tax=Hexamita inflata TaxID=28002 RepID=A0ABP1HBR4_9EUKA